MLELYGSLPKILLNGGDQNGGGELNFFSRDSNSYMNWADRTILGEINFMGEESVSGDSGSGYGIAKTFARIQGRIHTDNGGSSYGWIQGGIGFYTNEGDGTSSGTTGDNLLERMTLDYRGYLGIGTTSPSTKLHVYDGGDLLKVSRSGDAALVDIGYTGQGSNSVSTTTATIRLGSAAGDANMDYAVIERREWSASESSELLLFSGNDQADRIRLRGGSINFDSYTGNNGSRTDENIIMTVASDQITFSTDIIPSTDNAFDIGSPSKKVRDIYVSDNSFWIGDLHKIVFSGGKMKFRKRKTSVVPPAVTSAGGNETNALSHAGVSSLSNMKLQHWRSYMRTLSGHSNASVSDVFRDDTADYEHESAADAWLENGNNIYYGGSGNIGIGTNNPQVAGDSGLHIHAASSNGVNTCYTNDTTGAGTNYGFQVGIDGNENGHLKVKGNDHLLFYTNNLERMRIKNNGNVGIGTNNPSQQLHLYHATHSQMRLESPGDVTLTLWADNDNAVSYTHLTLPTICSV